jgi:hypothetical protein
MVLIDDGRRVLQCDVGVISAREVFRRARVIDFDTRTPAKTPPEPPEHTHATQDGDVLPNELEGEP